MGFGILDVCVCDTRSFGSFSVSQGNVENFPFRMRSRRGASIIAITLCQNYYYYHQYYSTMPPLHSESFLRHLENVKSSWPDSGNDDVGGVPCPREPMIDPMVQHVIFIVAGESNWI